MLDGIGRNTSEARSRAIAVAVYQPEASPRVMLVCERVELILEQHERHQDQREEEMETTSQRMAQD